MYSKLNKPLNKNIPLKINATDSLTFLINLIYYKLVCHVLTHIL